MIVTGRSWLEPEGDRALLAPRHHGPASQGLKVGNYVIERRLASGGEATVFLARDVVLRRRVAVKVLREPGEGSPNLRGVEEARLIATLDHPNIVRILHVELSGGVWYVAMEYMEGGSLHSMIRSEGPLDPPGALRLIAAAADALHHAHEVGVIHRDIKPKNLLLTKARVLKLADFGLAKLSLGSDPPRKGNPWAGTPQYMAPEVWEGASATQQSDLYSLGGCLLFMLTGRPPFPGETVEELRHSHIKAAPALPPGLGQPLSDLLGRTLAKKPEQRPAGAKAFLEEVRSVLKLTGGERRRRSGLWTFGPNEGPQAPRQLLGEAEVEKADAAARALPWFLEAAAKLSAALGGSAQVVLLEGLRPRALSAMARSAIQGSAGRLRPLGRVRLATARETLGGALASALGLSPERSPAFLQRLADRLLSQGSGAGRGVVHVQLERDLLGEDVADLRALAGRAPKEALGWLVTGEAGVLGRLAAELATGGEELALVKVPWLPTTEALRYAETWTALATSGRLCWSQDAALLLAHLQADRSMVLDALVHNAVVIALSAGLRLVTTWCVLGASAHSRDIHGPEDVIPGWRVPPLSWPDEGMLSTLRRLRSPSTPACQAAGSPQGE